MFLLFGRFYHGYGGSELLFDERGCKNTKGVSVFPVRSLGSFVDKRQEGGSV
jgi:hypothetical protein